MQVQIVRLKLFAMLNENIIAIGSGIARLDNASVAGCVNWGATRCGVVSATMGPLGFVNGVQSIGIEVRADASEIEWCAQKCFTHAHAKLVVIARIALGVGIAIRLKSVTLIGEASGQYRPVIESLTV